MLYEVITVCHMEVNPGWGFQTVHGETTWHFCSERCRGMFTAAPLDYVRDRCPVCGETVVAGDAFPA